MGKLFDQSHAAHGQGDGAGAKRLSDEARVHQRQMEALNKQASDWIFYGKSASFFVDVNIPNLTCLAANNTVREGPCKLF